MSEAKTGQLHTALATWIFLVDDAGHHPDDADIRAALDALRDSGPDTNANALGQALVAVIAGKVDQDATAADIAAWLGSLFGDDHIGGVTGEDRDDTVRNIRRAQFATHLPWLARIIDRFPGGDVGAHWLLVERVDDQVTCMDPYPWDDLDEQYTQPVLDFMVKWELAGGESVRWVG